MTILQEETAYQTEAGQAIEAEVSSEERLDRMFATAKKELDTWLLFRVKNELVVQLYRNRMHGQPLSMSDVEVVLQKEITLERDTHFQTAFRIESEDIPQARLRELPEGVYKYSKCDVDMLWDWEETHTRMVEYIQTIEQSGEGWLSDMAGHYVARAYDIAEDEVNQAQAAARI